MAQIEGGDNSDEPSKTGSNTDKPETDADDFAAELEKVAKEAETAAQDDNTTQNTNDTDDELDQDQQKAFESIMAEIDGSKGTEKESSAANKTLSAESDKKATSLQKEDIEKDQNNGNGDTDDISDDIEDILKEITSDLDASDDEGLDEQPETNDLEVAITDDGIVNEETGDTTSEKRLSEADTHGDKKATEKAPEPEKEVADSKPDVKKANTKATPSTKKVSPLPKVKKSIRIGKKTAISVSLFLIISFSLAGYYYKRHFVENEPERPAPVVGEAAQNEPVAAPEAPHAVPVNDDSSDQYRLKMIGDDIDQLRSELIAKRKEIEELQEYYQTGIDAEIQNVVKRLQETSTGRPITLKRAMAEPVVSMSIKAIQRRDSYINKLKNPANTLYHNSEELLYLSRKVALLMMMTNKTSGMDIDGFISQADEIMGAHRNALAQLNIDDVEVPESNIAAIWQRIDSQMVKYVPKQSRRQTENEAIWAAVCRGNFSQKHELTALSPEAARCLASWKGKDLFLNKLITLSPAVARQLADWKGEWLGLNGLKDLSPEAAAHLAKWKGKELSLNGLTRLSPRIVAILSEWQGDQIELINVRHMAHWENPKTRLFLSEEMGRKINGKRQ
jgi:hypothetical protein